MQSTRLADPFEPLNSSLAQSAEELGRWKGNRKLLFFRPKSKYEYTVGRLSTWVLRGGELRLVRTVGMIRLDEILFEILSKKWH